MGATRFNRCGKVEGKKEEEGGEGAGKGVEAARLNHFRQVKRQEGGGQEARRKEWKAGRERRREARETELERGGRVRGGRGRWTKQRRGPW